MKLKPIIDFFEKECSFYSQVYQKLPWRLRWFYHFCVIALLTLAVIILYLAIRFGDIKQWFVFWLLQVSLISHFGILLHLIGRSKNQVLKRYRKLHNNKEFDAIAFSKLKNELRSNRYRLFTSKRIQSLKDIVDLEAKNLTIGLIKLAAIAAVILGAIFAGFVQTLYKPYGTPDYLNYNGAVLLVLGVLGVFVCQIFLWMEDLLLMLKNQYNRRAALIKLSKLLTEMLFDDELPV